MKLKAKNKQKSWKTKTLQHLFVESKPFIHL